MKRVFQGVVLVLSMVLLQGASCVPTGTVDPGSQTRLKLSVDNATIGRNQGLATVMATINQVQDADVVVQLDVAGTAVIGVDYDLSDNQIVIPAGLHSGIATITALNPAGQTQAKTILLSVYSVSAGIEITTGQVACAVIGSGVGAPPEVNLTASSAQFAEQGGSATVTATLSHTSSSTVIVALAFSGTATPDTDYTASADQIVIPAGSATGTITLTGIDDTTHEGDETIIVGMGNITNGAAGTMHQVTVTITDDDPIPTVSLSINNASIAESGGTASVTATLSNKSTQNVTVALAFAGTATVATDYTRSATQIVIPAGSTVGSITLTGVNNSIHEATNLTIDVSIGSVTNGTAGMSNHVTATIVDANPAPAVSLSVTGSPLNENGGTATVTATLSNKSTQSVTVNLGFGGTATVTTDYTRSATQIVISAGSTTGSITLTGVNNNAHEGTNLTIITSISSVINGSAGTPSQVTATIADSTPAPTVSLGLTGSPLSENGGTATVTATLSNKSNQNVTVNLGFGGTAAATTDYTRSGTQIVIPAGSTTGTITLTGVNNNTHEGTNLTIITSISTVTNGTAGTSSQVTATITDTDPVPTVSLGLTGSPLAEDGGTATVAATLSNKSTQSVTVDLGFAGTATLTTDYTRSGTQIVIPAGSTSGSITLTGVDNGIHEAADLTIDVSISTVTNGTAGTPNSVTATIADADGDTTITFANNTLTYGSPSDLSTTIDPAGLNEVAISYGVSKASFQALNPQVVGFNGAPAPAQTLRTLVACYDASNTVTFTFPADMYNYGSRTSMGRGAFSGTSLQDAISTVPTQPDSLYDWFDATISSTGGKGVTALGFCVAFRNDQIVPAGQVLYTLSDSTTDTIALPALGGPGNPEYVFIGYQAPAGKMIARVQASRTSGANGGYVSIDDLSFVMATPDTTPPAAVTNLATSNPTSSSITLTWTAPSDPGTACTAYDIRYSTSTITDANFSSATQVSGAPTPATPGTNESLTVSGLSTTTTYYFAMKTSDAVPNWSAISNVVSLATNSPVLAGTVVLHQAGSASAWRGGTNQGTVHCFLQNWPDASADGSLAAFDRAELTAAIESISGISGGWQAGLVVTQVGWITDPIPGWFAPMAACVEVDPATLVWANSTANYANYNSGRWRFEGTDYLSFASAVLASEAAGHSVVATGLTWTSVWDTDLPGASWDAVIDIPESLVTSYLDNASATGLFVGATSTSVLDVYCVNQWDRQGNVRVQIIAPTAGAPSATLSVQGSPIAENGGTGTVTATLSGLCAKDVIVELMLAGTAVLDTDYTISNKRIVIPAGQTTGTATITAIDNAIAEPDKTIDVSIKWVANGVTNGVQQVSATIANDD